MKTVFHGAAGALFLGVAACTGVLAQTAPVAAETIGYLCAVDLNSRQKGWIAPEILFLRDGPARVRVVDGIVLHHNDDQPIQGEVSGETDSRVTYTWEVRSKDNRAQQVRMKYRATYFKDNGTVSVTALPLGYANSFNARGRCDRTG